MDARVLVVAKAAEENHGGRYALECVRFRKKKPGITEVTACNGRLLIEANVADEATFAEADEPILVPAEACERGLRVFAAGYKGKHFARGAEVSLLKQDDGGLLLNVGDSGKQTASIHTQAGEGRFPKTEDVWPTGDARLTMKFNVDWLTKALSVLRDVAGGENDLEVTLTIYGEKKPVRFDCKDAEGLLIRALVMPLTI